MRVYDLYASVRVLVYVACERVSALQKITSWDFTNTRPSDCNKEGCKKSGKILRVVSSLDDSKLITE